jgi:hypothetical protein
MLDRRLFLGLLPTIPFFGRLVPKKPSPNIVFLPDGWKISQEIGDWKCVGVSEEIPIRQVERYRKGLQRYVAVPSIRGYPNVES